MIARCSRRALVALAAAIAVMASGCSIADPYATTTPTARPPAATSANTGVRSAARTRTAAPPKDAAATVRSFTKRYINWRFDRLPAVKRQLAALAAGPLRRQLLAEAEQARSEVSRRASNQANHGQVQVVADPRHDGHYLVVTHEVAQLGDARGQPGYFVYRASTQSVGAGYRVTTFAAAN